MFFINWLLGKKCVGEKKKLSDSDEIITNKEKTEHIKNNRKKILIRKNYVMEPNDLPKFKLGTFKPSPKKKSIPWKKRYNLRPRFKPDKWINHKKKIQSINSIDYLEHSLKNREQLIKYNIDMLTNNKIEKGKFEDYI
jgi:hypothetical protein